MFNVKTLTYKFGGGGIGVVESEHRELRCCHECGSDYLAASSQMSHLCPEYSHWLYGYPPCAHEFVAGHCSRCGRDGSVSAYLRKLQAQSGEPEAEPGAAADGGGM